MECERTYPSICFLVNDKSGLSSLQAGGVTNAASQDLGGGAANDENISRMEFGRFQQLRSGLMGLLFNGG